MTDFERRIASAQDALNAFRDAERIAAQKRTEAENAFREALSIVTTADDIRSLIRIVPSPDEMEVWHEVVKKYVEMIQ